VETRAPFHWRIYFFSASGIFPAMSARGQKQKQSFTRINDFNRVSPDDVRFKMLERDKLAAMDDRDAAARWFGDPPRHRSALAMKQSQRTP
jgi:hypothetical protein